LIRRMWNITLTVSDIKKAVDFYENTLGLMKKYEYSDYAGFDCGGLEIGLKTWGKLEQPRKGEPLLEFLVDNVDESYAMLKERGVKFILTPRDTQWGGRIAMFTDLDGNSLELVQIRWDKYFTAAAPK
jgi:catechol 2,3-dioxygenase-like lactoylglutathione lyase family enzyme